MPTQLIQRVFVGLQVVLALGCHRAAPEHEVITAQGDSIRLELDRISDGKVHFFTFKHQGKNVNFFIRTDGEGTIRAHFDACYTCFKYRRGYVHEGNQVVCVVCHIGYDLDIPVWDFIGPCVPITLKCKIQKSDLVLSISAVKRGARFF